MTERTLTTQDRALLAVAIGALGDAIELVDDDKLASADKVHDALMGCAQLLGCVSVEDLLERTKRGAWNT